MPKKLDLFWEGLNLLNLVPAFLKLTKNEAKFSTL